MDLEAISGPVAIKNKSQQKGRPDDRCGSPKTKKKRSAMQLVRVALYMLKSGKSKPVQVDAAAASKWKKLLGSMRPLHVQSHQSPPRLIEDVPKRPAGPPSVAATELAVEQSDSLTPPMSPADQKSVCSSSMSQYASALNLQLLDEPSEDEEVEEHFYDGEGENMIDVKAEQFIAHFYQQMRLQQEAYTTRRKDHIQE